MELILFACLQYIASEKEIALGMSGQSDISCYVLVNCIWNESTDVSASFLWCLAVKGTFNELGHAEE